MKSPEKASSTAFLSQIKDVRGQITRIQRIWLTNIGLCLVTLAIGFVAIQVPWQEHRQQLASQYAEEKERSELLQSIVHQRTDLQTLEKKLLLEGGATVLTSQISRLATESGLEIESVTPQPEIPLDPYLKYQIEVLANSNLMNILRFLRSIETHEPLFWVDQLEIGELPGEAANFTSFSSEQEISMQKPTDRHPVKLILGAIAKQKAS